MDAIDDAHGILFPRQLPEFHRLPAPGELAAIVRWFWIPRWNLPDGEASHQDVLPFPASNLVVQPDGVTLSGPTTRISRRELSGSGWAVGMLLRPAGIAALHEDPRQIRDAEITFDALDLSRDVTAAMALAEPDAARRAAAIACTRWLTDHVGALEPAALLANALEDVAASSPEVVRVSDLAQRLHVSPRTVQRLAARYVGLPPMAIIRRYRLQESAQRLREDPSLTIAAVASDLGYADHAHLTADFRRVLGTTPAAYRRAQADGPASRNRSVDPGTS